MTDHRNTIRIVHLLGGLVAIDEADGEVRIGVEDRIVLRLNRPEYHHLFKALLSLPLQPVGVEFIYHGTQLSGEMPIEWQTWSVNGHLKLMNCQREWANIRHKAAGAGDARVASIAGKIDTFLELLNLRLFHLSSAYQAVLRAHWKGSGPSKALPTGMFSNMFMRAWRQLFMPFSTTRLHFEM